MCDVLLVGDDIQVIHTCSNTTAKRIWSKDTIETQVEVGSSKSFLCIPDFLYFGNKLTYNAKGKPIPVTAEEVKDILFASKWKDTIYLYQGAMPQLVRNSWMSDTCMVFFDIDDLWGGQHIHSLKGRSVMLGHHCLTILLTEKQDLTTVQTATTVLSGSTSMTPVGAFQVHCSEGR
jgi:hypothetical protein